MVIVSKMRVLGQKKNNFKFFSLRPNLDIKRTLRIFLSDHHAKIRMPDLKRFPGNLNLNKLVENNEKCIILSISQLFLLQRNNN